MTRHKRHGSCLFPFCYCTKRYKYSITRGLAVYRRLSNAYGEQLDEKWVDTAHYIPVKLQGDISLYDADLIIVKIVPNTGPSELANNTTPAASPQGQSPLA
jgi:hypothetical protein